MAVQLTDWWAAFNKSSSTKPTEYLKWRLTNNIIAMINWLLSLTCWQLNLLLWPSPGNHGHNIYLCSLRSAFFHYHDLEVTCLWPTFIFSRQIRLFETKCINGPWIQPSRAQCGYYHLDCCTVDWIHWNNLLMKDQDACLEKEAPADWDWAESIPRVSNKGF